MSDPWARADELDSARHDAYQRLKEAVAKGASEDERQRLEDALQDAMRDQAEEIERVVKSRGAAAPKPHAFKSTGNTIPNAYNRAIVGTVHECTGCGARIIVWPDGRSQPVTRPFPVGCK